jgi:anti-sigma factor RsiW
MSQSEIERLSRDIARDPVLRAEVEKLAGAKPAQRAAFAVSRGYGVTAAEIGDLASGAGRVLTDEQLEGVTGGRSETFGNSRE